MWFIACQPCVRLWIWAKDFKVAEKGTSASQLYLILSKTGCFRQLAGAWPEGLLAFPMP